MKNKILCVLIGIVGMFVIVSEVWGQGFCTNMKASSTTACEVCENCIYGGDSPDGTPCGFTQYSANVVFTCATGSEARFADSYENVTYDTYTGGSCTSGCCGGMMVRSGPNLGSFYLLFSTWPCEGGSGG